MNLSSRFGNFFFWIEQHGKQIGLTLLLVLIGYWVLKGCFPELDPNYLPSDLTSEIDRRYNTCITYYPIWYGSPKQPDCGNTQVRVVGRGVVPPAQKAAGVEKAICFKIVYTNPELDVRNTIGHDEFWKARSASKVTHLQNGKWQLTDDRYEEDAARWKEYSCGEDFEYESNIKGNAP